AATHRQRHEALFGGPGDDVEDRLAVIRRGGDVEEAELVGAGGIIGFSGLHRIAGIDEVDEIDALDDTAVLDVETGDDAGLEGHDTVPPMAAGAFGAAPSSASASAGSIRPS